MTNVQRRTPARWGLLLVLCWAAGAIGAPTHLIFWQGSFATAREAATVLHKPILLHFSEENTFDQQFDTIVYRDPDVILFAGHTCLPFLVRGDAVDSESVAIREAYHIKDYPTVVLIKGDGREIDRMVGYQSPLQFLISLQDFLNDTNTVGNLSARLRADTSNIDLAFRLAVRYELRAEVDSAMWLMQEIVARGNRNGTVAQNALFHLAVYESRALGTVNKLTAFYFETPVDTLRREAALELLGFYERHKSPDSLRATFERCVTRWPNDAEFANDYAWALAHWKTTDLDRADALSARAVALDPKNPDFLDTRAEVFVKKNRLRDAIACIDQAIKLRPHDLQLQVRRADLRDLMQRAKPR